MSKISTSTHPLITETIIEDLNKVNIHTEEQFVDGTVQQITKSTNLNQKSILLIKKQILNRNAACVQPGNDIYKEVIQKSSIISTPYKNLNDILKGGFYTGNIYEICGLPATGKTTFCYHLVAFLLTKYKLKVLLFDLKRDFNAYRFSALLNRFENKTGLSKEDILSNTLIQHADTINLLIEQLFNLRDELRTRKLKLRLVIIDSLPVLVKQIAKDVERRNMLINCLANIMRSIAVEFYVVFVVTNLLTQWFENNQVLESVNCGKYWQSIPNVRLKFQKTTNEIVVSIIRNALGETNKSCNFCFN